MAEKARNREMKRRGERERERERERKRIAAARRIGDGDRWMVGGLASPGSTVRRLTSVRGFYYDVLESCGVRRKRGSYSPYPNGAAQLSAKSFAPLASLFRPDLHSPIFTSPFRETDSQYILCTKKNLTPHQLTEKEEAYKGKSTRSFIRFVRRFLIISATNDVSILKWMDDIEKALFKYTISFIHRYYRMK
ncbi:hypothetical protein ALC56_12593 [Trachymyrmex septentrionalis]|uniref:Uncharacterized protein n=1 Tax=Trachymyrmex septentrionalis TaxID=34720 RepID=A0A195EYA0_9HYME|nr:hypothetical protein ALC56_12593 [Trachymyrmex septentrionalis]